MTKGDEIIALETLQEAIEQDIKYGRLGDMFSRYDYNMEEISNMEDWISNVVKDLPRILEQNERMQTELKNIRCELILPITSVKDRMVMSESITEALGEEGRFTADFNLRKGFLYRRGEKDRECGHPPAEASFEYIAGYEGL
jgi:hypothetical protein